jgi:hypothetical protein
MLVSFIMVAIVATSIWLELRKNPSPTKPGPYEALKAGQGKSPAKEDLSPIGTEVTHAGVMVSQPDPFVLLGAERVLAGRQEPGLAGVFGPAERNPLAGAFAQRDWSEYDRPAYARRWR